MPILQFGSDAQLSSFSFHGIHIHDIENESRVERMRLPEHSIGIVRINTLSETIWQGERRPVRAFEAGSTTFFPARTEFEATNYTAIDATVIRLEDRLFSAATEGHIDTQMINYRFEEVNDPAITQLSQVLKHVALNPEYQDLPILAQTTAMSLVLAIVRKLSPNVLGAFAGRCHGLGPDRQRRVTEYVTGNLNRAISLSELAGVAALSQFHFCRQFQKAFGMSPARYIARRRIDKARRMLARPGTPIAIISHECGFSSQSHFTAAFKTVVGITPSEYRRKVAI